MNARKMNVGRRKCYLYDTAEASYLLIQPVDENEVKGLEHEVELIREQTSTSFSLLTFEIDDWQQELTPWAAPPVFGKIPFGDGASETLAFMAEQLLPQLQAEGIYQPERMRLLLGGYSLAGLFALWSAYATPLFSGIAAVSPSVWYPGWLDFASSHQPLVYSAYLSLGDKEERAKNAVMSHVGNAIRSQHELLKQQGIQTILEWNPGNHFVDAEKRMAKGFVWLMNE